MTIPMPTLLDWRVNETQPSVRAVFGHWLFGYFDPHPDGNGRMARIVTRALLASGGYPWTVIRVENRDAFIDAIESASIDQVLEAFARATGGGIPWSLEQAA